MVCSSLHLKKESEEKVKMVEEVVREDNNYKIVVDVPTDPEYLKMVRDIVASFLKNYELEKELLSQIQVSLTECCSNIIKHSPLENNLSYKIEFSLENDVLQIEVFYYDKDFYPHLIKEPDFSEIKEGGLGVYIMRSFMDKVEYEKNEESGAVCVRMKKKLI